MTITYITFYAFTSHYRYGTNTKDTNNINNRLLHSLFLGNVDTEEVVATISEFDESFASQVNTGFRVTSNRKDGMSITTTFYLLRLIY